MSKYYNKHEGFFEYVKDAAVFEQPWRSWQYRKVYGNNLGAWQDCIKELAFLEYYQYRRKPVPVLPLWDCIKYGQTFYYATVSTTDSKCAEVAGYRPDSAWHKALQNKSNMFRTRAEAEAMHYKLVDTLRKACNNY